MVILNDISMGNTHQNVGNPPEKAKFAPGDLVVVNRPKSDGSVVRRPVLLLSNRATTFVAAKIIGCNHLPAAADLRESVAISGCGLRHPSMILPGWYFQIDVDDAWRLIGRCPTPIFNDVITRHIAAVGEAQFGRRAGPQKR